MSGPFRLQFAGKAGTLLALSGQLASAQVLPGIAISAADWRRDRAGVLAFLIAHTDVRRWGMLAVRSSAAVEDGGDGSSHAGAFHTELNVAPDRLADALSAVFEALPGVEGPEGEGDCAFIQPMLRNARCAGVAFGLDPDAGAPYTVINYDDASTDTDAVTSGRSNSLKTWWVQHEAPAAARARLPAEAAAVVALVEELALLFGTRALDIEFAFGSGPDGQDGLTLLQARPLKCDVPLPSTRAQLTEVTRTIATKIRAAQAPHPFLHGRRTVYGVMPDWNPAEIIGVRPRPLALSLYRDLVTDAVWAYQRHNYGYRNLRSFPLLIHFHGLPYIDVRVSFNSFVPRDLDGALAERLVNHYIDCLLAQPTLHDKVEFDIVFSCYTFDLPLRLQRLAAAGFSGTDQEQLTTSLRALTNRIIGRDGLWCSDRDKLESLATRRTQALQDTASLDDVGRVYWLLEDCKRYGTLPFAGLARAGFVAMQLLRSLQAIGVLSAQDTDAFLNSLDTVSGRMARDLAALPREVFLAQYGHLRPGTYDLLSPRYDEAPEMYFGGGQTAPGAATSAAHKHERFALSLSQMRSIEQLLKLHGIEHDVVGLFDFIEAGITLREYAKFEFTRNLSDALTLLKRLGAVHGFDAEAMSYADIGVVSELYASAADPRELLAASIDAGRKRFAQTRRLILPPLITDETDAWVHAAPAAAPNFVTHHVAVAPVMSLERRDEHVRAADGVDPLDGKIVAIPSADPGWDWLFAHRIAGFITAYGGVNSHMAIRANELGLPAVIGAGETLYKRWAGARRLKLDCEARRVEILG